MTRFIQFVGLTGFAALLAAACGGSVNVTGNGDQTSTSGTGCPAGKSHCCESAPGDLCCSHCSPPSGSGGAGSTSTSTLVSTSASASTTTGTGSGGKSCSADQGVGCAPDEYCDYSDDQCGGNDGGGTCKLRPAGCPAIYALTCGCDGKTHGNACEANAAGADSSNPGGCKAPQGMFGCGAHFCALHSQYCEFKTGNGSAPPSWGCATAPPGCGGKADCSCLGVAKCGAMCQPTKDGGFEIICQGQGG